MIRQIFVVAALNFRSLRQRLWPSMVIVSGLAVTIGVLLSMMSVTMGISHAYLRAGDPGRAIVISIGAETESGSSIPRAIAPLIMDAPGVARDAQGKPLADVGLNMTLPVLRKDGTKGFTTLRGVKSLAVRPEIKLVSGRAFQAGKREVIVGLGAQEQFQGMEIGNEVVLPDGTWLIVGSYSSGDLLEGQVIGDVDTLMAATRRAAYNSVLVRLTSEEAFGIFKDALTTNPALSVSVERHSDWYRKASAGLVNLLSILAYSVGIVMALGALFGCLNTMYSAVSARSREIATLRAIGFGAFPVAVSVILEAMFLSVSGALIGSAAAWLLYDGVPDTFGQNVFKLSVPLSLIGLGIGWALAVALVGGLLPSLRAGRRPVVEALRET